MPHHPADPTAPTGTLARTRARVRDETGAQAAEYAMLGGVSAAACGALVMVLKDPTFLGRVVGAVVDKLVGVIGGWF